MPGINLEMNRSQILRRLDSGVAVEARIKTHDPAYVTLFHNSKVDGIAGRQAPVAQDDLLGASDGSFVNRQHLVHNAQKRIERRLDRLPAVNDGLDTAAGYHYIRKQVRDSKWNDARDACDSGIPEWKSGE